MAKVERVELTVPETAVPLGGQTQLTARAVFTDGTSRDVTLEAGWSSSGPDVLEVGQGASGGRLTALRLGAVDVRARFARSEAHVRLTVVPAALRSLEVTPDTLVLPLGRVLQLSAFGRYTDGSRQELTSLAAWTSNDAAVAQVSNEPGTRGRVSSLGPGSTKVSASLSGLTAEVPVIVTGPVLTSIAVTPAHPSLPRGVNVQQIATGTYSDGNTQDLTSSVVWASTRPSIASVSNLAGSRGLLRGLEQGESVISATLAGVSGSTVATVGPAALSGLALVPSRPRVAEGTGVQLVATGTYTDQTSEDLTSLVTWSSSQPSVATVSNSSGTRGLALAVAPGISSITATRQGLSASAELTVTSVALTALSLSPVSPTLPVGSQRQFLASGTFSDGSNQDLTALVNFSSSNPAVASVSNSAGTRGLTSALAPGSVVLSATLLGVTATTPVNVSAVTLTQLTVTPTQPSVPKGGTLQLTASGTYSDQSTQDLTQVATWTSSHPDIVSVSNDAGTRGRVTALQPGSATISASSASVTGSTAVTVSSATLSSVALTPAQPVIAAGTQLQLAATGTYSDSSTRDLTAEATWSSSDAGVATVSNATGSKGVASAISAGTVTVGAVIQGVSGSAALKVTSVVLSSLALTPPNASAPRGTEVAYSATGTYSDSSTQDLTQQVTWASSAPTIASLSNAAGTKGRATALDAGQASVSATLSGVWASTPLTVTDATLLSLQVSPDNSSVPQGSSQQYSAWGSYSDGSSRDETQQVTWLSSNTTVATVSNASGSKGLVNALSVGPVTLSATLASRTDTTQLTVTAATLQNLTIDPASASIAAGSTRQLVARGSYSDGSTRELTQQVTWGSSNAAVASVSNAAGSRGLATGLSVGNTTVTATLAGANASAALTVTSPTLQSITVSPAAVSIKNGQQQQFTAMGTWSDGSTQNLTALVTWSSSTTNVATISNAGASKGLATGASPGSTNISASWSQKTGVTSLTVTTF